MDKIARRELMLNATIQTLSNKGLEGLTHRAVDQQAGLPQGSTSYYFPKKSALLTATADALASILEKDCDALQVGFADHVAKDGMDAAIEYVANELVIYTDASKHLFMARMELTLAATRNNELIGVGERLTEAARRPIAFFLKLISHGKGDMPIETCAGLIDGITLMHATGQGPKPTTEQVAAVFRSIL